MVSAGVYETRQHDKLTAATTQLQLAQRAADSTASHAASVLRVDSALSTRAAVDSQRAVHFEQVATRLQNELRLTVVPDTCRPIVVLADSALAAKDSAIGAETSRADSLSKGLDSTRAALTSVVASERQLGAAASIVARAAKPSLISRLLPHTGFGLAAGVDALGQPHLITGITLGWTF